MSPPIRGTNWIREALANHFQDAKINDYIDLNNDGRIDPNECTDLNNDNRVSLAEWRNFIDINKNSLQNIGFFRFYFQWHEHFSLGNPIHDILAIEYASGEATPEQLNHAYQTLARVLQAARRRIDGNNLSPQNRLKAIYDVITEVGLSYHGDANNGLLIQNIRQGTLDCDTSSFIVLALAREYNWPVHLVHVPEHIFVRWDDGHGIRFNIDRQEIHSDQYYIEEFEINRQAINNRAYLQNYTYANLLGLVYQNAANETQDPSLGNEFLRQAIALNPHCPTVHSDLALRLGGTSEALEQARIATNLDPEEPLALRAIAFVTFHSNTGAPINDFFPYYQQAIELEQNRLQVLGYSRRRYRQLASLYHAIADDLAHRTYLQRLERRYGFDAFEHYSADDIQDTQASGEYRQRARRLLRINELYTQGLENFENGKNEEALQSFQEARRLDPDNQDILFIIGRANFRLRHFAIANRYFDIYIAQNPNHLWARELRGLAYIEQGQYAYGRRDLEFVRARHPEYEYIDYNISRAFFGERNVSAAIACLHNALEHDPDNFWVYHRLGLIYFRQGQDELAVENFQRFSELQTAHRARARAENNNETIARNRPLPFRFID
ncbi:MAG: tetratricopeptide repeat protein [Pseudomonadota bacterium]